MSKNCGTQIVSGFPGIGKSYFANIAGDRVVDFDSSRFSWLQRQVGGELVRNGQFPQNYISYMDRELGRPDMILVSSHQEVREALSDQGYDFIVVYPAPTLLQEYLQRFRVRGDDEAFLNLIELNWGAWIRSMQDQDCLRRVELKAGQYLYDAVSFAVEVG